MLTQQVMTEKLKELGICEGDSVVIHSSFKSLGEIDGGAKTVVDSFLSAVGENGTVIFPTLCSEDWLNVYKNWHMDAPSDVGYLTNYFRKLPGALRSNQATHSVAAIGKDSEFFTNTHGQSGLRYGIFGDTPFATDSPWQKMYEKDTKMIFIGVPLTKCTMRHLVEYIFVDECLEFMKDRPDFDKMKETVRSYHKWGEPGVWPSIDSEYIEALLQKENRVNSVICGNAEIKMLSSKDFVETGLSLLKNRVIESLLLHRWHPDKIGPLTTWLDNTGIYKK